ncbi:MAG: dihydrolipoamide acetyltransferase family protein [Hyphomicrobiaceae bacterium]
MDVLMPQLGETVAEGKITKWFKAAGESVAPGETLFEIETDKTSMEVPAIASGVLSEILVPEGDVARVGAVVAVISEAGTAPVTTGVKIKAAPPAMADRFATAKAEADIIPMPHKAPVRSFGGGNGASRSPAAAAETAASARRPSTHLDPFREVRTPERNYGPARLPDGSAITPLARRLAVEAGVDLGRVSASGPHGRIMARDIGSAIAGGAGRTHSMPATTGAAAAPRSSAEEVKALYEPGSYEEVHLDSMRRTIAARLVEAKQTIPHFYLTADFDLDALLEVREQVNAKAKPGADGKPAYRISVNDFLIKALAASLQRVPAANAAWAEDRILYFERSDVAVAVAVDGGLLTPVIRQAETKSVAMISKEMRELAAKAKARKLQPNQYRGGATTISNLGMYGVREFAAIINPPQATIFAIGAADRRPVEARGGGIRFVTRMTVTVSCDHRVVDGALGAELLATFKGFIEQPVTALV